MYLKKVVVLIELKILVEFYKPVNIKICTFVEINISTKLIYWTKLFDYIV